MTRRLTEILQNGTENKQPLIEQKTNSTKQRDEILKNQQERNKQIRFLISQCDDAFKNYGREPEALNSIVHVFSLVLCDQSIDDIRGAFNRWIREMKEFPVPNDILEFAQASAAEKRRRSFEMVAARPAEKIPLWTVPWDGLYWDRIEAEYLEDFMAHLASMDIHRAIGALKYYRDWVGMPNAIFKNMIKGIVPADLEIA